MEASKVLSFALYELRRAAARKKVLALIVLTILIATVPYYLLKYANATIFAPGQYPFLWVLGVIIPNGFFIPFTAILIAAGSMAEEYEQGTVEVLLSKPVSRDEFIIGKYLGGVMLLYIVIFLNAILSLVSATITFGTQGSLLTLPETVLAQALSSLLFYSLAFMCGELVRRSSLSYIIASSVYFASEITGIYLGIIYRTTQNVFYQTINKYLPTSPVSSLPELVSINNLPAQGVLLLRTIGVSPVEDSIIISAFLVVVYTLFFFFVSREYFNVADISKKVS